MSHPAPTEVPLLDAIRDRYSPRAFTDRALRPDELLRILEAGRWAASCSNIQPWRYLVASRAEAEGYAKILGCLAEGNQRWAKDAPVLMLVVARETHESREGENAWAWYDAGQATSAMAIEASSLGIQMHQMAGFDAEAARTELAIPEGHAPVAAIAIGYPADPATLPDDLRARETAPRVRKPLEETVFGASWGTPALALKP